MLSRFMQHRRPIHERVALPARSRAPLLAGLYYNIQKVKINDGSAESRKQGTGEHRHEGIDHESWNLPFTPDVRVSS